MNSPAAAAKERVRLPRGIDVRVATERLPGVDEHIEETRRKRLLRGREGEAPAHRPRRYEPSWAKSSTPRKRAASPKEVTCEQAAQPSRGPSTTVPAKRQQGLLEKSPYAHGGAERRGITW